MSSNEKPTRAILLETIAAHPGITERELGELTGFSTSKMTPSRIRLWEAGEIEPTSEAGWKRAMVSRVKEVGWRAVEPDRRADVAERAKTRTKRNAKNVEQRAARIVEDLHDPTVHRLVMKMLEQGAATGRHLRRNEEALRKQHTLRRQEAKRQARDQNAAADMKKLLVPLWDARGAVAAVDDHLLEERARVARGEPQRIPNADWLVALRDVVMILNSFGSLWDNIRDLGDDVPCPVCGTPHIGEGKHLPAFSSEDDTEDDSPVVDAEVIDV